MVKKKVESFWQKGDFLVDSHNERKYGTESAEEEAEEEYVKKLRRHLRQVQGREASNSEDSDSQKFNFPSRATCPECDGEGITGSKPCSRCGGTGMIDVQIRRRLYSDRLRRRLQQALPGLDI